MTSYLIDSQTHQQARKSLLIRSQIAVHSQDSGRWNQWQQKVSQGFSRWVRLNFTLAEQQQTNWCWSQLQRVRHLTTIHPVLGLSAVLSMQDSRKPVAVNLVILLSVISPGS